MGEILERQDDVNDDVLIFFDMTRVISGYDWNLSFETRKGFKSHRCLTICLRVCCGRCRRAMEMPFCGPVWAWANDSCRLVHWWFKAIPTPMIQSYPNTGVFIFLGDVWKNAVGHPPKKTHWGWSESSRLSVGLEAPRPVGALLLEDSWTDVVGLCKDGISHCSSRRGRHKSTSAYKPPVEYLERQFNT